MPVLPKEELPVPRCPHCSEPMPAISYFSWEAGAWLVFAVYCPAENCHKTLQLQILPNLKTQGMQVIEPS